MIIAGIDEAGYGPLLGPLVVGCCAFEVSGVDDASGELPCLWKKLGKLVSRNRLRSGKKLHVNDSKAVYSPALGLKELERSVLALLASMDDCGDGLHGFLDRVSEETTPQLADYPWYAPAADERFPLEQEPTPLRLFANGLRAEMARTGCRCVHLRGRVMLERPLNRLFNQTRNKANALFSVAAVHLDRLLRTYGEQGLVIFCDRQGGRAHYGPLLRLMFDEWDLEILSEADARSEYRLTRNRHPVRLIFCEKAEAQCLPVAVASMLSKYLREALMRRFNHWWRTQLPDIEPTAGYYNDGTRFLRDIEVKRRELGIQDEELIRSR